MRMIKVTTVLLFAALAVGCTDTKPQQGSALNTDTYPMTRIDVASRAQVWRWRADHFQPSDYRALKIEPLTITPAPKFDDQVSRDVVENIRQEIARSLKDEAQRAGVPLTRVSGEGVLTLRPEIVSVNVSLQEMKLKEAIPMRLLFSGAELALGLRDQDVTFLFEYTLIDSETGEVLLKGVRHANTAPLKSDTEQLTSEHAAEMLRVLAKDISSEFRSLQTLLNQSK